MKAIQDQIPHNHCFGCGPYNSLGLKIKSFWQDENQTICHFKPGPHHSAGPCQYLNGGIIATVFDCHGICTAIAKGYQLAGRDIGEGEQIWYVTGNLDINYLKPTPIDREITFLATVEHIRERKMMLKCRLEVDEVLFAEAKVTAIRVPPDWKG